MNLIKFFWCKKLSDASGRLIIASDGIWDAVSSEMAAKSCRGLPAELAARQVVKVNVLFTVELKLSLSINFKKSKHIFKSTRNTDW